MLSVSKRTNNNKYTWNSNITFKSKGTYPKMNNGDNRRNKNKTTTQIQ